MGPTDQTNPTPTTLAAWCGWLRRRGGRWWIACQADSEAECFRALLDASRQQGLSHADLLVLPRGQEP